MQLPEPAPDGVKTPPVVMVPPVAVQVTLLLNAPVPSTLALQVAVCAVVIEAGVAVTVMEVIVAGTGLIVTEAEAEVLPPFPVAVTMYCKTPVAVGVTVTVPLQVTDPDKLPEPTQEAALLVDIVNTSDWPMVIDADDAVMDTEGGGMASPPPLLLPPQPSTHVSNIKGAASIKTALRLSMSHHPTKSGPGLLWFCRRVICPAWSRQKQNVFLERLHQESAFLDGVHAAPSDFVDKLVEILRG
jgi:hypothetical protein